MVNNLLAHSLEIVSTYMQLSNLSLELLKVGVKVTFPLVQEVVGFLPHLCHYHLELVGHQLHAWKIHSKLY